MMTNGVVAAVPALSIGLGAVGAVSGGTVKKWWRRHLSTAANRDQAQKAPLGRRRRRSTRKSVDADGRAVIGRNNPRQATT